MEKKLMSGMRPTGKLHLGHYIGVLENWVNLQNDYDCYFEVADIHALTTNYDKTDNLKDNIINVIIDWLASGINPEKSHIFIQSCIPSLSQLHLLLSMITPQNWVVRDPTLKDMAKILNSKEGTASSHISYGLMGYPVLMSTDILGINCEVVPVGIDQVAHIEITRDIASRFNYIYNTNFFQEPKPLLTKTPLLPGVDGQKMGKSFNNDIKLSDNELDTEKKILKCITDSNRIKKTDQGNPENCLVSYKYYEVFAPNLINNVYDCCTNANIGCIDCKRQLANMINNKFKEIRENRLYWENHLDEVYDIIFQGTKEAKVQYDNTYSNICEIMKMYKCK